MIFLCHNSLVVLPYHHSISLGDVGVPWRGIHEKVLEWEWLQNMSGLCVWGGDFAEMVTEGWKQGICDCECWNGWMISFTCLHDSISVASNASIFKTMSDQSWRKQKVTMKLVFLVSHLSYTTLEEADFHMISCLILIVKRNDHIPFSMTSLSSP